jgi:hypothetical protein
MKSFIKPIKLVCCFALLITGSLSYTPQAKAGGWPTRKGKLLISPSVNYFYADKYWDQQGKVQNYAKDGHFTSTGLYIYSEYGLTKRVTLVGSVPVISNHYEQSDYKNTSTGIADMEFGARYYLANINYKYYFAIQGMVVLPGYKNTPDRNLGYEALGGEVKLIGSGSGKMGKKAFYFNLEGGVRQYVADKGPFQFRYTGSFGLSLAKKHQVIVGASGLVSSSTNKTFSGNLVSNKDFSYTQGSFSYGYSITPNFMLFAGVNRFLVGTNTGIGTNGSLSVVVKL